MGRQAEGLSDFLTFISPICIIILFFLCLFRFLFSCCACKLRPPRRRTTSNAVTTETGLTVNSMGTVQNCSLNMPSLPLNYIDYDNSSTLFPSPFIFSADRFPPKYEDAIKMPNVTPRRASCSAVPPPFYDNASLNEGQNEFASCQPPPAYWSLSRQATMQGHRPTGTSGLSTISTNNTFIVPMIPSASVSQSNTSAPMELSPALLAEKRLRVGLNAVRHASLSSHQRSENQQRPVTSFRPTTTVFASNPVPLQSRPFTTHTTQRYTHQMLPSLPGQIAEAPSTQSLDQEFGDPEKGGE